MEKCFNHPEREALSFCHNCKNYYCEECLVEGREFYFCRRTVCQRKFLEESQSIVPQISNCPNCGCELELSENERLSGKVVCPECDSMIDFNMNPPGILTRENFVDLLSSLNQGDIGLIKSILDDAGIEYYVFGENFLSTEPLLQPARFFVNENQLDLAKEMLKDFDLRIWGASKNN